jgi:hypothetical protein
VEKLKGKEQIKELRKEKYQKINLNIIYNYENP